MNSGPQEPTRRREPRDGPDNSVLSGQEQAWHTVVKPLLIRRFWVRIPGGARQKASSAAPRRVRHRRRASCHPKISSNRTASASVEMCTVGSEVRGVSSSIPHHRRTEHQMLRAQHADGAISVTPGRGPLQASAAPMARQPPAWYRLDASSRRVTRSGRQSTPGCNARTRAAALNCDGAHLPKRASRDHRHPEDAGRLVHNVTGLTHLHGLEAPRVSAVEVLPDRTERPRKIPKRNETRTGPRDRIACHSAFNHCPHRSWSLTRSRRQPLSPRGTSAPQACSRHTRREPCRGPSRWRPPTPSGEAAPSRR